MVGGIGSAFRVMLLVGLRDGGSFCVFSFFFMIVFYLGVIFFRFSFRLFFFISFFYFLELERFCFRFFINYCGFVRVLFFFDEVVF